MSLRHEIDFQLGEGDYRLVVCVHSREWWLIQVPFLGKAWNCGFEDRGYMSWGALRRKKATQRPGRSGKVGMPLSGLPG